MHNHSLPGGNKAADGAEFVVGYDFVNLLPIGNVAG